MTDEERDRILDESYATLERGAELQAQLEERNRARGDGEDGLERWTRLHEQSQGRPPVRKSASPGPLVYKDAKLVPFPSPAPVPTAASDDVPVALLDGIGEALGEVRMQLRRELAEVRTELAQLKTEVANIRTANAEQRTLRHRERELAQGERVLHGQQVEHLRNEVARLRTDVVETLRGASDIEQREQVGDGLNLLRAIAEELKARRY